MLHERNWQNAQEQLGHQVSRLAREVGEISRTVERMSAGARREAGETAADLMGGALQQGELLAREVRRQAREVGKFGREVGRTVRKDPVPVIVGAAAVLLLLSLLFGRKR
jgi:methyl-accepting chemotaxis protein